MLREFLVRNEQATRSTINLNILDFGSLQVDEDRYLTVGSAVGAASLITVQLTRSPVINRDAVTRTGPLQAGPWQVLVLEVLLGSVF